MSNVSADSVTERPPFRSATDPTPFPERNSSMKSERTSALQSTRPRSLIAGVVILLQSGCSLVGIRTTEEPNFTVLQQEAHFEVREYAPVVVAETLVDEPFDEAGNIAFGRLFGYISGKNAAFTEIAMTAPVMALDESRASGEQISMTAPVIGEETPRGWRFAFVLPADYTLDGAPRPSNPEVRLNRIPARKVAVLRYSGSWNETAYAENFELLRQWMRQNRLQADSLPRVAAYDPPWTLPFLRRNEVMIDIGS